MQGVLFLARMTGTGDLKGRLANIAQHTTVTLACLTSIWLVHFFLTCLLGPDWRFLDLVPIRYVVDAGELGVLAKLIWRLFKEVD